MIESQRNGTYEKRIKAIENRWKVPFLMKVTEGNKKRSGGKAILEKLMSEDVQNG